MTSPAGAAAQGDAGAQQAQGEGQATESQGLDAAQIAEHFDQLRGDQQQMQQLLAGVTEQLQAAPWAQADQQETQTEQPPDLSFLDDPAMTAEQAAERMQGLIDQRVQQGLDTALREHISPLREDVTQERYHREIGELVGEFPEMGDPEVAQRVAGPNGLASQLAEQLGQPELAASPRFWRVAYLAGRAMDAAQQESGAESPGAAHLEGGGGATPSGPQVDLGDLIVKGGEGAPLGARVLDF